MIIINGYSIPHKGGFVKGGRRIAFDAETNVVTVQPRGKKPSNLILLRGGFAKVQGDRKALPVKALCKAAHLAVPRAESYG